MVVIPKFINLLKNRFQQSNSEDINDLRMKLAPILAKYLATNKQLSLPGLGTFHADNSYDWEVDSSKKTVSPPINITFEQNKITAFNEELISFISQETGKMRVLSESDLASELDAMINFLNTGKPYFLNGIGTLTKRMDGTFEFHKEKFQYPDKKRHIPITEKNFVPQSYIDETRKPVKAKPAIIISALCILAIAASVWFYVKNAHDNNLSLEEVDTTSDNVTLSTSNNIQQVNTNTTSETTPKEYKYVLEIAKQPRASKRYSQLKNLNWPVNIATSDSIHYTLYIQLPASNADTTKIKDSLSVLSGKRVWIER